MPLITFIYVAHLAIVPISALPPSSLTTTPNVPGVGELMTACFLKLEDITNWYNTQLTVPWRPALNAIFLGGWVRNMTVLERVGIPSP